MPFYLQATPITTYQTTPYDFGASGVSPLIIPIQGAAADTIMKRVRVAFAAGTKTGAGNISVYLAERYTDPISGAQSYTAIPQTIAAAETTGGDITVRVGAADAGTTETLSAGQVIANALTTAVVANNRFTIYGSIPVARQVFLILRATDTATLVFGATTTVEQMAYA